MAPSVSVLNMWSLTVFIYNKQCPIILCCVYCFHRNFKTLCSHVVSVMSVIKKSNNSEDQILNTVGFSLQTWRVYHALVSAIISIYFFLVKRNFAKNVNCGLQHAAKHEDKVWLVVLKKYFLFMQEVMLHFLFFIGLLGHSNLVKSQLSNTHNKNCKHMLSLESFLWLQHSMLTSLGQRQWL